MPYAQLVIGPPGSGKTTYCKAMAEFLSSLGRKVQVVNLDPANDNLPYPCAIDISSLITLQDVMENFGIGPNGSFIYCMEFLECNASWLFNQIQSFPDCYFLFDCPGQIELYTHHDSLKNMIRQLQKQNIHLTCVHLLDSVYCTDAAKFISAVMTCLSTMIQIELPHVNILSKVDLLKRYNTLDFDLSFYTEVLDLSYLLPHLQDNPMTEKYAKLNEAIVGLIQDYSLVTFLALNLNSKDDMLSSVKAIDKANGYIYQNS